ncbi:cell division protein DivIC [Paraliobacillus ryukyuensis]|uniref:Cell division protein DivIC n=1 Tax=Paraliobacillus ryukyuensis TaxID=200904 RepID=A0A366DQG4_9BACI|nr:septum formation initiator family protein [Paraliobacillus ryukyuensis]RBO92322.1 cell division protein DivIC [Paraliobacillus ryukyuensis]
MGAKHQRNVSRIDSTYVKKYDAYVERQRKKKKRLKRRLALFAIIVCVTFGVIITYHINQRVLYADKKATYQAKQEELQSLQTEEADLTQKVNLLNDEDYVLQIAKTNYFFTEEGEIVFKLPETDPSY